MHWVGRYGASHSRNRGALLAQSLGRCGSELRRVKGVRRGQEGQDMKKIVLIGGIGSGKSSVCEALGRLGAGVVKLDDIGHEVLSFPGNQGGRCVKRSVMRFSTTKEMSCVLVLPLPPSIRPSIHSCSIQSRILPLWTSASDAWICWKRRMISSLWRLRQVRWTQRGVFMGRCGCCGERSRRSASWARACARGGQSESDVRARMAQQPSDERGVLLIT